MTNSIKDETGVGELNILLEALFDEGFTCGEDIVLQRQFENGRENYSRYRARTVKRYM